MRALPPASSSSLPAKRGDIRDRALHSRVVLTSSTIPVDRGPRWAQIGYSSTLKGGDP